MGTGTSCNCASTSTDLLNLAYAFPTPNNGDIQSQTISHPIIGSEAALNVTQNYTYTDALDRLSSFAEGSISQGYMHDRYGNHWVNTNSGYQLSPLTPTTQSWFTASSRLTSVGYDGRGNQTQISPYTAAYDGDEHQKSVTSTSHRIGELSIRWRRASGGKDDL